MHFSRHPYLLIQTKRNYTKNGMRGRDTRIPVQPLCKGIEMHMKSNSMRVLRQYKNVEINSKRSMMDIALSKWGH